ncbi:MAG: DUF305 domain-containing protein [Pseudonocardiales bacterium]|nr:DUF305 domain-containing protein [Actinomycetota bacterium]PZS17564.1 MAG: DUF305 domain-containing protein [Pseudonocardiales bacterium]
MAQTYTETDPGGMNQTSAETAAAASQSQAPWIRLFVRAGALLAVLLLGAALGVFLAGGPGQVKGGAVDVGFAQDMSVHHRQAVLMAGLARDRSTDPEIRLIAFDIETNQLQQIGQMQGWLSLWNAPPLPTGRYMTWMIDAPPMPGMAHGTGSGTTGVATMPGMASAADLQQLQTSSGGQFDVRFLQLMLRHHQGGTPMANYTAAHGESAQVRNLAEKIVVSQGAESDYLAQLIAQRGAHPLPPPS